MGKAKTKESVHGKEKAPASSKTTKERKSSTLSASKEKGNKSNNKNEAVNADVPTTSAAVVEKLISITIETLRNIQTRVPGREVTIHVEDVADFAYDSPSTELKEPETTLEWQFNFPCYPCKTGWLDELAANPLIFTLLEIVHKEKDKGGDKDKKKDSKIEHDHPKGEEVIGNCTLDLLPFMLGETRIRQVLLVEQDFDAYGHEVMTWPKLPQLTVCATIDGPLVPEKDVKESNLLFITLESLYNPTSNMTEDLVYQAATGLPLQFNHMRDIIFDMGLWTEERDIDKMKRWIGLANVGGRGAYSSYSLDRDVKTLKNSLRVDVCKKMNEESPRIEWNTLRRCWLTDVESEAIHNFISKNRWWPLEILIEDKSEDETESKGKVKDPSESTSTHLAAYFDVSALLYPGVTKTRVLSQVYTFCQEDMLARCGIKRSFYAPPPEPEVVVELQASVSSHKKKEKQKVTDKSSSKEVTKKSSSKVAEKTSSKATAGKKPSKTGADKKQSKDKTSKTSSKTTTKESMSGSKLGKSSSKVGKKTSKISKATSKDEAPPSVPEIPPPELKEEFSAPLYTEKGEPVFILLELQLLKPFTTKRPLEEAVKKVDELIPEREKLPFHVMTPALAETHFKECIQSISGKITTEYQKFIEEQVQDELSIENDIHGKFYKHLQDHGLYQVIKETLRSKITDLLREKMGYGFNLKERRELQTFLSDVYVYLIEQVNTIINSMTEAEACTPVGCFATNEDLYFFAKEACEQKKFDAVIRIFEDLINSDKKSPVWWLEYAVYWMGLRNWDKASQVVMEALLLDRRNKLGLLLYALLMSEKGEEKTAFVFFDALTSMYPVFMEGWLIFHLYNLKTKRHEGAVAALQYAERCSGSFGKDVIVAPVVNTEHIAWSTKAFPPDHSIFLQTAVLLMKLNATFYAEMALAQEFLYDGRSLEYAYYLAVNHFLEERYQDALDHLDDALIGHRKQMSLWALSGHCYFKLNDRERTLENYEFIVDSGESVADLHLITLRLAEYRLEKGNYADAKTYFLAAAKHRCTPRCWLGTAIACYNMNEFFEAEKALVEANLLDNSCPIIWAYLTLVNLQFHRQAESEQCFCQAMKRNLQDKDLLKNITTMRESLNYPDPCPL